MAKRRRHGMGSIIRVTPLSGAGVGAVKRPHSFAGSAVPVLVGGGVAAATAVGIRYYMTPTTPTQMSVVDNAPWIGVGAGALVSLAMWNMISQPAGVGALMSALLVGGSMVVSEAAAKARLTAVAAPVAATPTQGFGAVVPEYSAAPRRSGVGAIAMEPTASRGYGSGALGSYGEQVNLGNVNIRAFGTPGAYMGAR
jgi:hypothetical protein